VALEALSTLGERTVPFFFGIFFNGVGGPLKAPCRVAVNLRSVSWLLYESVALFIKRLMTKESKTVLYAVPGMAMATSTITAGTSLGYSAEWITPATVLRVRPKTLSMIAELP
jgi:hypothetical protein